MFLQYAMYCLILFYHELREPLLLLRPFAKLMCVKAVVFLTFWQFTAIEVLAHFKIVHATLTYSEDEVSEGLTNFLIVIEMFVASLAHRKYFSFKARACTHMWLHSCFNCLFVMYERF